MDVVADLSAETHAAERVQASEGPFHDPALRAKAGAVPGPAPGDLRCHAQSPDQAAVRVVAVAAVAEHGVGVAPGPAAFAAHRGYRFKQRYQLGDVMTVAAGQRGGQRDDGGVGDQMVLASATPPRTPGSAGPE